MRIRYMPAAAALVVGVASPAFSQSGFPSDSAIRSIVEQRVAWNRAVGLIVAIAEPGSPPRVFTAGKSGGDSVALGINSVVEIGSITKAFTGILFADMVRRGEVRMEDPVARYLPPDVKVPARGGRQITLLDLVTHTSGLPRMPDNFRPANPANPYADYTARQMYDFLSGHTLARDIGEKYEYSNLGMGLLGHALARRAGKSYEDLIVERVLRPLGMNDTRITLTPAMQKRLVPGHTQDGARAANWDLPTFAGAGALRSTAQDMLAFLAANLDSMKTPLHRAMAESHRSRTSAGPTMSVGLAWHVRQAPGNTIVWHNGGTGGYRTFAGFDPGSGRRVVVFSNSGWSADDIGFHLLNRELPLMQQPKERRQQVAVSSSVLASYIGVYELAPEFRIAITQQNDTLFAQATQQPRFPVFAESDTAFFFKVVDAQLTFQRDSSGRTKQLILHQNGRQMPGRRIESP